MQIMIFVPALLVITLMLFGTTSAQAQAVSGQGTWETTLLGRDVNLNAVAATDVSAVYLYDTTLDVTWLRDANVNINNGKGGKMNWDAAMSWADNLITGNGDASISDWRLPAMTNIVAKCPTAGQGYLCYLNTSEISSLYTNTLGNIPNNSFYSGPFQNLFTGRYWLINQTVWFDVDILDGAWTTYGGNIGVILNP